MSPYSAGWRGSRLFRRGGTLCLTLVLVGTTGGLLSETHARSAAATPPRLPGARLPRVGQRVLVFAPHPDDEVLGVGGFLNRAHRAGAQIQVVYFTCGDGYPLAAAARYRQWPDRSRMRWLAQDRRQEARSALRALGLSPTCATFLGYPDRGLSSLWLDRWPAAAPFTSRYTAESAVPAPGTYHPGSPYSGEAVLADVESLLRRTEPDFVYYSDPADDHPDHWAAHCFVQMARERLRDEPWVRRAEWRTYLVHRGAWPQPMEKNPALYLRPPRALQGLDVRWQEAELGPAAVRAKREALAAYKSQQAVSGSFLAAFVRRNELLGEWERPGVRPAVTGERRHLGVEVLRDSTRDRLGRAFCAPVDFTALEVQPEPNGLWLRARLRQPVASWPVYHLYWKPVDGPPGADHTRRFRLSGYRCIPPDARFEIEGDRWAIAIPGGELAGTRRIMVAADAWSGPLLLDRTPWRVVELAGSSPGLPFSLFRTVATGDR